MRSRVSLQSIHTKILKVVGRCSGVSVRKIARSCNLSVHHVKKALVPLLESGLVVKKNPGRYTLR